MKSFGNIDMQNNVLKNVVLEDLDAFPANPKVGSFALIQKRLMVCLELQDTVPLWFPLGSEISTHTHTQSEDESVWVINHDLGSSTVLVQAYDVNNKVIIPDDIDLSLKDTAVITFAVPIQGRAIIMLGNITGMAKPEVRFEQSFTVNATWTLNHGLGYNPIIRCIKDGLEIQPQSIVHDSTTTATITFSEPVSGKVVAI